MNKEEIVNKLFANQIDNIEPKYRLNAKDIVRLSSYISSDPFTETECCKWKGAISKSSHQSKYINFWFNKKKQALHRILYLNYKGELPKNKYLRFSCPNPNMRGVCCNINHLDLINKEEYDSECENETNNELNPINNQTENNVQNEINNQLNQQIGKTSKSKNKNKNKSNSDNQNNQNNQNNNQTTINSIINTYDSDKFVIVFED
jgi:hypothetical protein